MLRQHFSSLSGEGRQGTGTHPAAQRKEKHYAKRKTILESFWAILMIINFGLNLDRQYTPPWLFLGVCG